jgi:hypothetical protein
MGPLEIINKQCEDHHGQILRQIRIHPEDWPVLRGELIAIGGKQVKHLNPLTSVRVIFDESLMEGPVCDWL